MSGPALRATPPPESFPYRAADLERRTAEPAKTAGLPIAAAAAARTAFSRDRARVLHSGSFRRLAGKTQVVGPEEDAVPRTRLTHSLEVAQIARGIGEQLGCDPDLVDAAGLAHDIGHPPFGHNGEAALDGLGVAAGGFEANAQNLRLLTRLEPKVIGPDGRWAGLNLTRAALDAVVKYPWTRPDGGGKFGVYPDDLEVFGWLRAGAPSPTARSLEAQVMDWADDVAYSVHDVEDGVSAGRVDLARLAADPEERALVATAAAGTYSAESAADLAVVLAELLRLPAVAAGIGLPPGMAAAAAFKQVTSELTGRMATGAVGATRARYGGGPLSRYAAELQVPRVLRAEVAVLKAIAFRYVMDDPARRSLQQRQRELLAELVAALCDRGAAVLDPVFAELYDGASGDAGRLRAVLDQVSLLTDAQAVSRHRRLVLERGSSDR
jgi:dGTPase